MFRTLIVEDNQTFRQTLKSLLVARFPQMVIHDVPDGEEALRKLDEIEPDLVFMDIKLPGINGLEVTRQMRASGCTSPIVVLTSYDLPEYRESAQQSGADHFIAKGSSKTEDIVSLVQSYFPEEPAASPE